MPLDYTARDGSTDTITAYRDVKKVGPRPLRSNFPYWLIAPNLTSPTPETPAVARGMMQERHRRAVHALIAMDKVRRANRQHGMRLFVQPRKVA